MVVSWILYPVGVTLSPHRKHSHLLATNTQSPTSAGAPGISRIKVLIIICDLWVVKNRAEDDFNGKFWHFAKHEQEWLIACCFSDCTVTVRGPWFQCLRPSEVTYPELLGGRAWIIFFNGLFILSQELCPIAWLGVMHDFWTPVTLSNSVISALLKFSPLKECM